MKGEEMSEEKQLGIVAQVKTILDDEKTKARFNEILGAKAPQYMTSIVNTVSGSPELKKCDSVSIMSAAFIAASFDLPIDPNLGYAALVPYKRRFKNEKTGEWESATNAQFQMMYKGFIQLAIRTGEYEKMNCSEVYKDEILSYNPITGECEFVSDFSDCKMRDEGNLEDVAGYYAWFRLKSGFSKELYMSKQAVANHAKKYSQSYRKDLEKNWSNSKWSTDFGAMAKKTVLKMLLSKWGILSVQMQQAIVEDQKVYETENEASYADNEPEIVEAEDPFETALIEEKPEAKPVEDVDEAEFREFERQIEA
jgi:recombination protein RecT